MRNIEGIELRHSMACEMLLSIARLQNDADFLGLFVERSVKDYIPDASIVDWVASVRPLLTVKTRRTMADFFSMESFFAGSMIRYIVSENLDTIDGFMDYLRNMPEREMLRAFLLRICEGNYRRLSEEEIKKILDDKKAALLFITEKSSISRAERLNFLNFITDPKEMKERLIEFLEWYYRSIFHTDDGAVELFLREREAALKRKIAIEGPEYVLRILELEKAEESVPVRITLFISYYLEFAKTFRRSEDTNEDIYLAGYRLIDLPDYEHSDATLFMGLESEMGRRILRLISGEFMSVTEISRQLDGCPKFEIDLLLGKLNKSGLLKIKKTGESIYYSSDMDEIKARIEETLCVTKR